MMSSISEPFLNKVGKDEECIESGPLMSVRELKARMEAQLSSRDRQTSQPDLRESNFKGRPSFNVMPRYDNTNIFDPFTNHLK